MTPGDIVVLAGAGLAGGFVGGLVGVGGGVIFAPVLFFFLQSRGIVDPVLTPLTIGSSLFATLVTASVSAWAQKKRGAVDVRTAVITGLSSAAAVFVMTRFVTTATWYDASAFRVAFSAVLVWVGIRMLRGQVAREVDDDRGRDDHGPAALAGIGTAAGTVSSAVGVGGGIVLVPAYNQMLGIPIHRATGTSSAAIVLIALCGVVGYVTAGLGQAVPSTAIGYVDIVPAAVLSVAAAIAARLGVVVAHRVDTTWLRRLFAILALGVAARMLVAIWG